jgi:hypothetical protein
MNTHTLQYFASHIYANEKAAPGVGCTGEAPAEEASSHAAPASSAPAAASGTASAAQSCRTSQTLSSLLRDIIDRCFASQIPTPVESSTASKGYDFASFLLSSCRSLRPFHLDFFPRDALHSSYKSRSSTPFVQNRYPF